MYDAIAIGCCRNHAGLGVINAEGAIFPWSIGLVLQLALESQQLLIQVVVKGQHIGSIAFSLLGLTRCLEQILKLDDLGPEVAVALHGEEVLGARS